MRRGIATLEASKIKDLFHRKFLRESGEIFGKMSGKDGIITVQQNSKFEIFSINLTEKLRGYSTFPKEGNFIGQKCQERPMCISRPFRVEELEEKRWLCSV